MAAGDLGALTGRELAVAQAYARGARSRDVAEQLGIAQSTVRTHLIRVYDKLGVGCKVELARALQAPGRVTDVRPRAAGLPRVAVLRPFDPTAGEAATLVGAAAQAVTAALATYPDVRLARRAGPPARGR